VRRVIRVILDARTLSPLLSGFAITLLAAMTYVCHASAEVKRGVNNRLIEPGIRVGPVMAHSREVDLARLLEARQCTKGESRRR